MFGYSPYETRFELWNRKAGRIGARFSENERTILGQEIEPVIARAFARIHGVEVRPVTDYVRMPELGLGVSYDYEYCDPETGEWVPLDCKNVDGLVFCDRWKTWSGAAELSMHIILQAQLQALGRGA